MSNRIYHPPLIKGRSTPDVVVSQRDGAEFSLLRQRRYLDNGGSFFGAGPGIAIFTDGCCLDNGNPGARAGMGVYFGPNSGHSFSESLRSWPKTNQRAEIWAAILALRKVRSLLDSGDLPSRTRHLAIITDSAYVVNAMTNWVNKWRVNGYISARGERVVNADDFIRLDQITESLEDTGIAVRFWHVDRNFNEDADRLARGAAYSA